MIDLAGNTQPLSPDQEVVGVYPARVENLRKARVLTREGYILDEQGTFLESTYWIPSQRTEIEELVFRQPWRKFPIHRLKSAISLPLYWSFGYYHWICDVLPRMWLFREMDLSTMKVVVPHDFKPWMEESLRLLGVPNSQCHRLPRSCALHVKELLFPSPLSMTGDHHPDAITWVRSKLNGQVKREGPHRRLYITRRLAASRRVVEEERLTQRLAQEGFTIVEAENLTFSDQIRLFKGAECVVAPHGAGLTNILFARPSCRVVELFEPTVVRRCYRELANTLGFHHRCLVGHTHRHEGGDPDIYLSDAQLEELLSFVTSID